MKKLNIVISLLLLVFFLNSCKNEKSLQVYFVESSEKESFMYGDIPVGLMLTPKEKASDEVKKTVKSIKKINVLFLKKTKDNDAAFEIEKEKLKNIFTNKDYKTLGSVKAKGMNMKLYYTGKTTSIDEIIAFGYGKKVGIGVARLLGNNMNPAKIMVIMNNINLDTEDLNLNQFKAFF